MILTSSSLKMCSEDPMWLLLLKHHLNFFTVGELVKNGL